MFRPLQIQRTICCLVLALGWLLPASHASAAFISRTITIDGDMSEWDGIRDNPGQFSNDAEGTIDPADRDYQVQATGRDLRKFSVTYDATHLYFYVERYSSTSNKNEWWFYLDLDNDGRMQSGEPVFHVSWQGSNRRTERTLWTYIAADTLLGDPLVSPVTGFADGFDMPGDISSSQGLDSGPIPTGGSTVGTEMEIHLAWADLGLPGLTSLGFHIASSNGTNVPNQLDDNMDGITGNALSFSDLGLAKAVNPATSLSGNTVDYTITLTNLGSTDTTNVVVNDDLVAAGLTYVSDDSASSGTGYDSATGDWSVPLLSSLASIDLIVRVTATVTSTRVFNNTAAITASDTIDTDASNDTASASVTYFAGPEVTKLMEVVSDPVTAASNPKSIPGAFVDYYLDVSNPSTDIIGNVVVTDDLPPEMALFVGPLIPTGEPFEFIEGGLSGTPSGLLADFDTLTSTLDGVEFSNNGGVTFTYVPSADASGFDANVTNIRLTLVGTFNPAAPPDIPEFRLRLRARLR